MDKRKKKSGNAPAAPIADGRFASFETDPRYRLPSRKHAKTTIDKRFSAMLKDEEFIATAKVDRYGRKIKSDSKKKALQRLYQAEEDEDQEADSEDAGSDKAPKDKADSDDEEEEEEEGKEIEEEASDDESDIEVDDDEIVQRELRAAHEKSRKYDPARDGGFSSSESDSDSDQDEDDVEAGSGDDISRLQREEVETGEVTNRIAIVNLDWDHVKSVDLMALFSSFIPSTDSGRIINIAVYPSEFGKGRMQQEEVEGPPKALFKKARDDSDDDDSEADSEAEDAAIKKELLQEGNDQDFDSDALRKYQLDRLRYYYAVMTCSSPSIAQAIYEATDGTEYQSSSNVIDLRFVPDEVTFDDEPRDQCNKIPESYKPVEFVTNALQSSKVKLTWDMHPEEASRKDSIKRAFRGSRADINDEDLRAYLAGDSDSDEDIVGADGDDDDDANGDEPKLSKKELARKKMREALGLATEPVSKKSKDEPIGGMEITFTPALTEGKTKKKKEGEDETTIEKYARKERERKERKREMAKAKREDRGDDDDEDVAQEAQDGDGSDGDDLGFNDPFFTTADPEPASKTSLRKEERLKKREAREAAEALAVKEKAHLTKVMAEDADDNQADHLDHFDMNEIIRAEKQKTKKKKHQKKGKAAESRGGLQEDFNMDVGDKRFDAVFDSHEFAIDPSNPKFKATEGMKKLLEEGRKKRKTGTATGEEEERRSSSKKAKKARR